MIRIGTRGSALARWQADHITERLTQLGVTVEQQLIATSGDQNQQGPIGTLGGQGVFTKEIQRALLAAEVDVAVHSLKDLPTDPIEGLVLACVPERERTGDAIICRDADGFETLPTKAVIGTGSVRRQAQLLHARDDLVMKDIRGNVDTRLRKLDEGQYDAIILAEAGLKRLGWDDRITEVLPRSIILPAVGQGALGLETREDDRATREVLAPLTDGAAMACVTAERALLRALRGGCLAPVGALAEVNDDQLTLSATVLSRDGKQRLDAGDAYTLAEDADSLAAATTLGETVAQMLLDQGAASLIDAARQ